MLKISPFHSRTAPLVRAQTWRRWAGYQMASAYDPHPDREYAAIRNAAALIDVSPLHKYMLTGPDSARLLDRMITRDMAKCSVGQVYYTPWCDAAGKVIDDGTVSRLADSTYRLTSADSSLRWLHMNAVGMNVQIEDVSERVGTLALQGPSSRAILQQVSPADFTKLKYFRVVETTVGGVPVTVSRTGYTGDLGYEIWAEAARAEELWDALVRAGTPFGITPTGVWALDIARIEAGLIMLDVDYFSAQHALIEARKSSPYEINLGWAVSAAKGPFNGRRALAAERARGAAWGFVGLELDWDSFERLFRAHHLPPHLSNIAWRTSAPVYRDGVQVGYATSGSWSPLLKKSLALAHLKSPHFEAGTGVQLEITVEHQRKTANAVVRKLPFYDPERKKA
ncbi:MAG: aminomethyl transferase family protein [Candidatus Eisenbacteria bacterium]|uniref:Aminomethyl transferase family protein n=1 Tax=Eiseniibacteriota bacterium TaxID=2212470 RepID=A0A538TMT3_UNCEI|nr:MAG: aminomethyl transferase family protein [Candidatus Eisenbacteria bacterium]